VNTISQAGPCGEQLSSSQPQPASRRSRQPAAAPIARIELHQHQDDRLARTTQLLADVDEAQPGSSQSRRRGERASQPVGRQPVPDIVALGGNGVLPVPAGGQGEDRAAEDHQKEPGGEQTPAGRTDPAVFRPAGQGFQAFIHDRPDSHRQAVAGDQFEHYRSA